ncbi:MAG: hypothetical protein K2L01_03235 [Rikenellaceae bacterium]|nr:hypothetical protein [Rikenellaceae bacterium]
MGYTAGVLKIGSPDNWGNIGHYELPGGVRLQVTGGEFFDYKNTKALRASSGGGVFAFTVTATEGAAAFNITDAADWVAVSDKTVTVAPNTSSVQRECRIAVTVGGKNVGVFYIVQGKRITFSCATLAIADGRIEMVGGTGDASVIHTVAFDISDDELDGMDILADDNGVKGIIIETDRAARNIAIRFMPTVDASEVAPDGVSLPVRFVDVNGNANAILTVAQRPVLITFDPVRYDNVSYGGGTITAAVTTEDGRKWSFESATDKNGDPVEWIACTSPDGEAESGENMVLEVAPNTVTSGRTAEVRVRAGHTLSKPYEIVQVPSYGVRDITVSNGIWDAATSTLKVYSCYGDYGITFWTEMAIPEYLELKAVYKGSWIELGEIERLPDNEYRFNIYCEDSYSTEEEETTAVSITVDGNVIGGFTLIKALWPSFIPEERDIWGGVKDRPELKRVSFRVSDWDIYDFSTGDDRLTVKQISDNEIEIGYAETLRYDDEVIDTYVDITTRNLNNYTRVGFFTTQSPVSFDISEADLQKLSDVSKDATDVDITVNTKAGAESVPWRVASTSADWLTTDPAAGGTETNASGAPLTVKFAANSGGQRTGSFVLESLNTTSQAYEVSQKLGYDPYATVNIGGVEWMLYNLARPKQAEGGATFATKLPSECTGIREEAHGKLYQYGYNIGWKATGLNPSEPTPSTIWKTTKFQGSWSTHPCPSGFHLPSKEEYQTLITECGYTRMDDTWSDTNYGYITFTDNNDNSKKIEFLATGERSASGSIGGFGTMACYWTSSYWSLMDASYYFNFTGTEAPNINTHNLLYGCSIRCVKNR